MAQLPSPATERIEGSDYPSQLRPWALQQRRLPCRQSASPIPPKSTASPPSSGAAPPKGGPTSRQERDLTPAPMPRPPMDYDPPQPGAAQVDYREQ